MKDMPGQAETLRQVLLHWGLSWSADSPEYEDLASPLGSSPSRAAPEISRRPEDHSPGLQPITLRPVNQGLINDTFIVQSQSQRWLLQRIHQVFSPEIHQNIRAVTTHLRKRGLQSPQLVPTRAQKDMVQDPSGRTWRMLEFIPGTCLDHLQDPDQAYKAGQSLAHWHRALADCPHHFVGLRQGVHDTPRHLKNLETALQSHREHSLFKAVQAERDRLLRHIQGCAPLPPHTLAVGHGDPKINNLRWDLKAQEPLAWIDLDTVGPIELAHELGDALRSWCNPGGSASQAPAIDIELHHAAVAGYVADTSIQTAKTLEKALLWGPCWISLELASRFLADALYESYFSYDATRFASRGAHNLSRARGQIALFESFAAHHEARKAHILKALADANIHVSTP